MEPTSRFGHAGSSPDTPGGSAAFLGLQAKELAILALYIAMVSFAIVFYQQSEDEARAWMLCRSFPLPDMVSHILRYEGHPGLYYLLLWGLCHAGLPFTSINWIFAAIASAGIYLLLRWAPFPFYLRALIPFGFVLGYQYAINARSYVLFPLLGFSAVHLYRRVPARPAAMAVVLALLANVSLHGTMVAIGFAVAYGIQLLQQRREGSPGRRIRTESWLGAGLFATSILFVAFCVWPAKYANLSIPAMGKRVVQRLTGGVAHHSIPRPGSVRALSREVAFTRETQALPPQNTPRPMSTGLASRLYLAFLYPISAYPALSILYEVLIALLLLRRRRLVLLLPFALLACFLVAIYVQVWHAGLIWITLLLILWAVWDKEVRPTAVNLQNAVAFLLVLLCTLQLGWTFQAIRYERHHATYPARATASYLKTLPPSERIDGNEVAFSVMPFFSHYIFLDDGAGRFNDHTGYPTDLSVPAFVARRADVILLRSTNVTAEDWRELGSAGYGERHRFCGAPYFPNWPVVPICIATFEKNSPAEKSPGLKPQDYVGFPRGAGAPR